jgi:hypothetical protein
VAASLIARTFADVFLITNGTAIERFVHRFVLIYLFFNLLFKYSTKIFYRSIITSNRKEFIQNLAKYVSAMPFVSYCYNYFYFKTDNDTDDDNN